MLDKSLFGGGLTKKYLTALLVGMGGMYMPLNL
jgi:hypothetical protein